MPVGFLLFDESTKGFDDVWFVEEGEIKSVKGGTSVPVIVLGQDEKKSVIVLETNEWSFGPKPLDISPRVLWQTRQLMNARQSLTIANRPVAPVPFHRTRLLYYYLQRVDFFHVSINIMFVRRYGAIGQKETKNKEGTVCMYICEHLKTSTRQRGFAWNPVAFRYTGPFLIEECSSVIV